MMALVFVFQAVTFTIHKCSGDSQPPESIKSSNYPSTAGEKRRVELFAFDPNNIGIDSLQLLGFSYRQALTIIHYREKGGRFRKKEDFSRMYSVSPQMYEELAPYIVIPGAAVKASKTHPVPKAAGTVRQVHPQPAAEKEEEPQKNTPAVRPPTIRKPEVYIDINEADSAALVSVKGIGPYFCRAILSYRKALGSFANIEQLMEIRGMDQEKFDRIKGQVFVHPAGIKKFSIADADENFLRRHPYIGAYNARGIALFIQSQGKERCTLKTLCENNILSAEDTLRLHPYME